MSDLHALLQRASLLLEQGRHIDAEKNVKDVLQHEPENDYALALLSRCYFSAGSYDKGLEAIKNAIGLDPENAYYFYLCGFAYYHKEDNDAALHHLNKALSLDSYNAEYFGLAAFVKIEERQFEQALNDANRGLALDSENITCLNARSRALNKLKKTDDALETMQNALAKDPDNEFTHANVGWNYLEKGKQRNAIKHFREALRIDPNLSGAQIGLKEAMKSNLLPYKLLLQYSIWISEKGKTARWIIPIAILIGVRIISRLSIAAGSGWKILGSIVLALYLLFVATSWVINPLSNLFLLFHKDGKYALNNSEKWNAKLFLAAISLGLALVLIGLVPPLTKETSEGFFLAGLVSASLALPSGHMDYPWKMRQNSPSQSFSIAIVIAGLIALVLNLAGLPGASAASLFYFAGLILYLWVSAFASK
jgi:tetratricopeptide (TPR) repeat protein/energy-converting hydrogenase Eha subunit A